MYRLWSSENQIVVVRSRSRRTKPITKHENVHCDWFILPLLLLTPIIWFSLDHKRNVSDGVIRGVRRNGNVLILLTPIPSRLWLCLQVRFLIFTRSLKRSYDSNSDSVASENQPLVSLEWQSMVYPHFHIFHQTMKINALPEEFKETVFFMILSNVY